MEVNDLAIVTLIAIDRHEEGDLSVWLHVAIPSAAGASPATGGSGGGMDPQGVPFITLYGRGKTVLEASRRIQLELPRRLFFAHMRVILLGERLALEGAGSSMDFLTRHRELRLTNYVLAVRGDLAEIMAAPVDLEKLPVEYLREISRMRLTMAANLADFTRAMASYGADPVIGTAERIPPPKGAPPGQRPKIGITGSALFRDDKLVGYLDQWASRGLLWLRGENQRGAVTASLPEEEGDLSIEYHSAHVERRARLEDGRVTIHIKVRIEGDLAANQAKLDLSRPERLEEINQQMSKEIKTRMKAALDKMWELNVDAAGFGEVVHEQLPRYWKQVEKDWLRKEMQRSRIVLDVETKILRTGLSSQPRGVREEELR